MFFSNFSPSNISEISKLKTHVLEVLDKVLINNPAKAFTRKPPPPKQFCHQRGPVMSGRT